MRAPGPGGERPPGGSGRRPRVALVDHGAGNLVSIEQALTTVGADVLLVRAPDDLLRADAIVLPGVGAARPAMDRLARRHLVGPIRAWAAGGRPFLGICLGLQLLFEASDEDGSATLGVLRGRTVPLDGAPTLPHIGWNQVERLRPDPLLDGIPDGADLYFVHSYAVRPSAEDRAAVLAETEHGARFVSAVGRGDVYGVQFHPERSGRHGLAVLRSFVRLAADRTAAPTREAAIARRPGLAATRRGGPAGGAAARSGPRLGLSAG